MNPDSPPTHVTTVRGADLAWTETGSGPPALWAHGLTSSSMGQERFGMFDWSPISTSHRLIRYDARGHGLSTGSPEPEDYTWVSLGRDLLGLLDAIVGEQRVVGIGSSMGTATLLHAATERPDRFDRLVLTTPPTAGRVRSEHVRTYLDGADLIERSGLGAFEAASAAGAPPAILASLGTAPSVAVSEALLPSILRGAALTDLPDDGRLATLDLPVLVLAWSGDPGHPLSTARRLVSILPDARLQIADTPSQLRQWSQVAADFLQSDSSV